MLSEVCRRHKRDTRGIVTPTPESAHGQILPLPLDLAPVLRRRGIGDTHELSHAQCGRREGLLPGSGTAGCARAVAVARIPHLFAHVPGTDAVVGRPLSSDRAGL